MNRYTDYSGLYDDDYDNFVANSSKRSMAMSKNNKQPCEACGGSGKSKKGNWFCYYCGKKVLFNKTHKDGNIRWHNECYSPVTWKA